MPLSWNEIKDRALKFSLEWEGEKRERAEKDTFWNEFFYIFGITRRRLATFEEPVKKLNNKYGFIDLFWKGTLLVEHKSKGKDLDAAFEQATDYFHGIKEHELPKYVLVSDFEKFRLYDLDENKKYEFATKELHKNIKLFGFVAGYQKQVFHDEHPVNIKAAEKIGKLHDMLQEIGYEGHQLEVYLVRIMFILFAEDTGIFEKNLFWQYLEHHTKEDGSDLAAKVAELFQVLNTPRENRLKNIDEDLDAFPYVNGKLFEETLPIAAFDKEMRNVLIENCSLEWSLISPAIFGSLFQSIMDKEARRNLGAHYTSEKNIMKVIKPLFLDNLWKEFEKIKYNRKKLEEFHDKLSKLKFLDPACGSGNFLIISYRELRLLELEVIRSLLFYHMKMRKEVAAEARINISSLAKVEVDQFYGIEIDEWAAKIAETAMWLIDHQMNLKISEEFGNYFARIPLTKSANIHNANALQLDWEEVVPKRKLSYILGNPPFIGKKEQSKQQKKELLEVLKGINGAGVLDYVTGWYISAAKYMYQTEIKTALVSTNSVAQGEQVGVLWNEMFSKYMVKIHFAHRTFRWDNEAKGKAAVHVVIIGFASQDIKKKFIFDYVDINGEPDIIEVKNINPYLVEGNDVVVLKRSKPISVASKINYGSIGIDGGFLIFDENEKIKAIDKEPFIAKYILPYVGGNEFINNKSRYCLWLKDASPNDISNSTFISERVKKVKEYRAKSNRDATKKLADFPSLFGEIRQPDSQFVLIPKVSSENRKYIPLGFLDAKYIANGSSLVVPQASLFEFGLLTSEMHMAWMKYVAGRLESRFQYSNTIVYNNYPFPKNINDKNKNKVENAAQNVLDTRTKFPDSSLADLYDPITMPPALMKAHQALDKAVDLCYRPQPFTNERNRIEYLFDLFIEYTRPLEAVEKKEKKKRKKK